MATHDVQRKSLEQIVEECGRYPMEAFDFVRQGLTQVIRDIHGATPSGETVDRHISGQQLCLGLRDFALRRYGLMARAVLRHWNITRTEDFGRIVFAMIESRMMHKTPRDDVHDFDNVFDFATAFEPPPIPAAPAPRRTTFNL